MIYPLTGFKIAGVIWYQGESNVGSSVYDKTFSALITSWRKLWKSDFPFYYVQIAPYNYGENHFGGAIIRDAQRKVLQEVPNTGMAMTSDISPIDNIHPKDKKSVGTRLANLALANTYKTNTALVNGPLYKGIKIEKNKVVVSFDFADGLHFSNTKVNQFEMAGADGIFYEAEATLKNNTVVLQSDKVKNPVKVRYAWKNNAQSQLFNKANLSASSFISE
jgi:sialate O-acetylesterase